MATLNLTTGGTGSFPAAFADKAFVLSATLDATKNPMAALDVAQLINLPAKTLVLGVQYDVVTANGAAATFDLGDGSNAAGFVSNANANAVGSGYSSLALTEGAPNTVTGYTAGKYYSAADTLDLVADAALSGAKITVRAICLNLG